MCKSTPADSKTVASSDLALRTDWVAVDGEIFDLKALAAVHPGGDHIRAFGGTDATASFHSLHPYTAERNKRVLVEKFRCANANGEPLTLNGPSFPFVFDSPFATELKAAVRADLKQRGASMYAATGFWLRTALIAALTLFCEWKWISTGALWAMVGTGVCHALIGLAVQHDASHGALSRSSSVNDFFAYGADWIGNSRWLWFQQHIVGHHPHTNIEGVDGDAHSAEPFLQFHWAPVAGGALRKFFARHQHLYMYLVLAAYGPSVVYDAKQLFTLNHGREIPFPNPWMSSKVPAAVAMRAFFLVRTALLPALVGGAPWYAAALGVPLVDGAILTFLFVLSHNFEGSERHPLADAALKVAGRDADAVDWYAMQASTSCSYGGRVAGYLTGGLNMQIEHHLLPRLSSWQYPLIAPTVRRVCEKHGVRYVYFPTIWDNIKSTVRFMRAVGGLNADGADGKAKAA